MISQETMLPYFLPIFKGNLQNNRAIFLARQKKKPQKIGTHVCYLRKSMVYWKKRIHFGVLRQEDRPW